MSGSGRHSRDDRYTRRVSNHNKNEANSGPAQGGTSLDIGMSLASRLINGLLLVRENRILLGETAPSVLRLNRRVVITCLDTSSDSEDWFYVQL